MESPGAISVGVASPLFGTTAPTVIHPQLVVIWVMRRGNFPQLCRLATTSTSSPSIVGDAQVDLRLLES